MFADSLLDNPRANRLRRGWTTLASFGLQALVVGALLMLPLIYTQGMPQLQLMAALVAPAPPPGPPPAVTHPRAASAVVQSNMLGEHLLAPQSIPQSVVLIVETSPPPPLDPGSWIPGGTGDRSGGGSVPYALAGPPAVVVPPPPPVARPPRVSRMMEGNLVHKVQPEYPPLARAARIQGSVVLKAIISKEGTIKDLKVVNGHPMLVKAALEAVSQWRYRPYYLNNEPVEVETQVTVNFVLSGG
jgi:periplasmic protein TonB